MILGKSYLGNTEVVKMYLGNTLVYSAGNPNLITNGTFNINISGWSNNGAVFSWNPLGYFNIVNTEIAKGAYQSFTTEIGVTYKASANSIGGSPSTRMIRCGNGTVPDAGIATSVTETDSVLHELTFTATSTTSYIYLRQLSTGNINWDNVEVKEI